MGVVFLLIVVWASVTNGPEKGRECNPFFQGCVSSATSNIFYLFIFLMKDRSVKKID